jgi:hypothetical protein
MLTSDVNRWVFSSLKGVHKKRLSTISAVVWAFLSVVRLGIAALGRALGGPAKARHNIKRVWRLIANPRFDPVVVQEALLLQAAELFRPLVLSLDWVELKGGCRALVAAVCLRRHGRALPVAWVVVKPRCFRRSQNSVEDAFVERLAKLLAGAEACIVADRGFRRASLLTLLGSLGLGYVIRVCAHVHVSGRGHTGLLKHCGLSENAEADLGRLSYREDGFADTRIVWRWERAQDEPWILATNLDKSIKRLCEIYALRMEEEESFRDLKSHRFGAALRYLDLSDTDRYERMLAIWALGTWLLHAQGYAAVRRDLHHGLSTASNRRRDLSFVSIGRLLIPEPLGSLRSLFSLLAA